jgi:hypothetical protein
MVRLSPESIARLAEEDARRDYTSQQARRLRCHFDTRYLQSFLTSKAAREQYIEVYLREVERLDRERLLQEAPDGVLHSLSIWRRTLLGPQRALPTLLCHNERHARHVALGLLCADATIAHCLYQQQSSEGTLLYEEALSGGAQFHLRQFCLPSSLASGGAPSRESEGEAATQQQSPSPAICHGLLLLYHWKMGPRFAREAHLTPAELDRVYGKIYVCHTCGGWLTPPDGAFVPALQLYGEGLEEVCGGDQEALADIQGAMAKDLVLPNWIRLPHRPPSAEIVRAKDVAEPVEVVERWEVPGNVLHTLDWGGSFPENKHDPPAVLITPAMDVGDILTHNVSEKTEDSDLSDMSENNL